MLGLTQKSELSLTWQGHLQDYVTAIAWSPNGRWLALASGSGEVTVLNVAARQTIAIEPSVSESVDCLGFSYDGQFLAAGGQSGQVKVWRMPSQTADRPLAVLLKVFDHPRTWIDHLAWSPTRNELAFSLGRYAQVWDIEREEIVTTLPFETSSVLGLVWHPQGEELVLSGHLAVKIWSRQDWERDPIVRDLAAAGVAIAISPSGQYLASGNLDSTLLVWHSGKSAYPWKMTGFPGKVRHLAWSEPSAKSSPLIAAASQESLIIWRKLATDEAGWDSHILDLHQGKIVALSFQPGISLLASAAEDGQVVIWHKAKHLAQMLNGASQGFSSLAWNAQGTLLAAGGQQGEWLIWAQSQRGRGFSR